MRAPSLRRDRSPRRPNAGSGAAAVSPTASSRPTTPRASTGGSPSSARTSNATFRSSVRAFPPRPCAGSGRCSPTTRGRRTTRRPSRGLDVNGVTIARYLDLLVDLLLVRRLQPWTSNLGRRLVKAPKVYIRDSGVCHALLGIETVDDLLGHPVVGGSWEGFVIENVAGALPARASFGHYRTAGGAEVDLGVDLGAGETWAVEIKRSSAPQLSRGFHSACEDLRPTRRFVVHGGGESFPLAKDIRAMSLPAMVALAAGSR